MYQLVSYAVGTFIALFPITNPVGAVPIFYSLTANVSKGQRLQQAKKVALNASGIIAFFFVTGKRNSRLLGNFSRGIANCWWVVNSSYSLDIYSN